MIKKIIKSRHYRYPSKEERFKLEEKLPEYIRFKFNQVNLLNSILNEKDTLEETSRKNDLHQWNITLSNRLGKLKETYIFLLTHFERGFQENHLECDEEELVGHILFDYYAEIFYYFFFSTRDTIAQLLNVYFNLGIAEHQVKFGPLMSKLKNTDVEKPLSLFYKLTKQGNDYSNSLTHKFPVNQRDYRSDLKVKADGNNQLSIKRGHSVKSSEILKNINELSDYLSKLLIELKAIFEK